MYKWAVLFLVAMAATAYASEHVLVLTQANFDEVIANNEHVLVEFYAPWCGHCQRLEPEYNKAADELQQSGSPIRLAKVDATVETALGERFEIRGFPTLKFFKNGVPQEYDGERTAQSLVSWVTKKSGPATKVLETQEALDEFIKQEGARVVGFVEAGSDAQKVLVEAASQAALDAVAVGEVNDASLLGDRTGKVVLYNVGPEPLEETITDAAALIRLVVVEASPLLDELSQTSWKRAFDTALPLLAVFYDVKDETFTQAVAEVAKQFKGKAVTVKSDAEQFGEVAERWGASGKVFPTAILLIWKGDDATLVVHDEEKGPLETSQLADFVEQGLAGTYQSYRKSEPIPETNDGPVKVVVGKNFDDIVLDATKDVLVEFYAPWCGHCQKLAPIYEKVGEHFQSVDHVVIAKSDATANAYPPNIQVHGFPTLMFFPANNKEPVPFEGNRDLAGIVDFVKSHSTQPIELEAPKEDVKEDL